MEEMRFNRELYSKIALLKAAYNFTDVAYLHLDADDKYYYIHFEAKDSKRKLSEKDFINELLSQSVRHEIYCQTKSIRELMLARALATSVISNNNTDERGALPVDDYREDEILKDWFAEDENNSTQR